MQLSISVGRVGAGRCTSGRRQNNKSPSSVIPTTSKSSWSKLYGSGPWGVQLETRVSSKSPSNSGDGVGPAESQGVPSLHTDGETEQGRGIKATTGRRAAVPEFDATPRDATSISNLLKDPKKTQQQSNHSPQNISSDQNNISTIHSACSEWRKMGKSTAKDVFVEVWRSSVVALVEL